MTESPDLVRILKSIVISGGLILNVFRGKVENIPKKSDLPPDKVRESSSAHTIVDDLIQGVSLEILHSHLPEIAINAEEQTPRVEWFSTDKTGLCFHLDPLDGTLAYTRNRNDFTIGAAFSQNLNFIASAIFFPAQDRLYYAERDKGVHVESNLGKKIPFSRPERVDNKYVQKRCEDLLPVIQKMELEPFDSMSAHHTMISIAEGKARMQMYHLASPHDFGIPKVILEEAGCVCTDLEGNPVTFDPEFKRLPYFLTFFDKETKNEFFEILKS